MQAADGVARDLITLSLRLRTRQREGIHTPAMICMDYFPSSTLR
jgi:hypothetical protein